MRARQISQSRIRQSSGLTLLEVLIVVAIVGIISSVAMPSFTQVIQGSAAEAAAKRLHQAAVYARQEARARGQDVTIHAKSGAGQYSGDLEIYTNASGRQGDFNSREDTLLRRVPKLDSPVAIYRSTGAGDWIHFGPRGQLHDDDNHGVAVVFCAPNNAQAAYHVKINSAGRIAYDERPRNECRTPTRETQQRKLTDESNPTSSSTDDERLSFLERLVRFVLGLFKAATS